MRQMVENCLHMFRGYCPFFTGKFAGISNFPMKKGSNPKTYGDNFLPSGALFTIIIIV